MLPLLLTFVLLPVQESFSDRIEDLRSSEEATRDRTVRALRKAGARAVPDLLRALRNEMSGLEEVVEGGVALLESPEWKERDAAMRRLARMGRHAVPFLTKHRDAENPEVAWRVRSVLAGIASRAREEQEGEFRRDASICEILADTGDASCTADLMRSLRSEGPKVRLKAAQALVRHRKHLKEGEAAESAGEILRRVVAEKKDATMRSLLLHAAGNLGTPSTVPALSALLRDPEEKNSHFRGVVLRSLAAIGTAEAMAEVVRALRAESPYVRNAALDVLEKPAQGTHGYDPRRDPAGQGAALRRFQQWWEQKFEKPWSD